MALQRLGSQAALEDCEAKTEDTASRQAPSQPAVEEEKGDGTSSSSASTAS